MPRRQHPPFPVLLRRLRWTPLTPLRARDDDRAFVQWAYYTAPTRYPLHIADGFYARNRVPRRHARVIRNKDVSRYSATDLSAILGHASMQYVPVGGISANKPTGDGVAAPDAAGIAAGERRPRSNSASSALSSGSVTRQRARPLATAGVLTVQPIDSVRGDADVDEKSAAQRRADRQRDKAERRAQREIRRAARASNVA